MRSGLIKVLLRLYPQNWRTRYEAEFSSLLEQTPPGFTTLLDILTCAVSERLNSFMEGSMMHPIQRALPALFIAWLMAVAAGINLQASVDDNPLVAAMRSHAPFMNSWVSIEAGSIIGLAAVMAVGTPLLIAMFKQAEGTQRRQLIRRLLVRPGAVAILLMWMAVVLVATRGHWAPMPWAVTGDWIATSNWPPLATRWMLGTITLLLLLAAGLCSAIAFRQIVRMAANLSLLHRTSFQRISIGALAISLLLMTLGTGLWGFFAHQYAPAIFHAKFGGLLNLSTFSSWLLSFILFTTAAAIAIRGARQYSTNSSSF
jgi:hypothetical protein